MTLTRYYFISDDLDDLEAFEEELERENVSTTQIHLLTLNESEASRHHHLHQVTSFMKQDIIHSTLIGIGVGVPLALLVLLVAYTAGWTATSAGWAPFVLLSLIVFGFCAWQGGLWGIQTPNVAFKRFDKALKEGRHVFFVDAARDQGDTLKRVAARHTTVEAVGYERGAPAWLVFSQYRLKRFFTETFP
ncbi:hypothetical protein C8D92_11028 [Tamilnaduibacter salinus]|uniref:NAD/FAD-utilizing enzyme n=1 Tax=Tamilnaduibacter salinus TaxID=1484056 RepID=A0A2A2I0M1_9GAMM|nr:NAD/FAD-utilizing enzyme [Tamilnaduibacter salinus]PAV25269.1 NAD/FAD-utilizing enzyme [Tamilnaduibacter salinus]PVY69998.1 hypothetical protein C8D92_11028 [Tamilnaduibacter salinus]